MRAAIALIPALDGILPNPGDGVTLFAPSDDGVDSLLSTAGVQHETARSAQ